MNSSIVCNLDHDCGLYYDLLLWVLKVFFMGGQSKMLLIYHSSPYHMIILQAWAMCNVTLRIPSVLPKNHSIFNWSLMFPGPGIWGWHHYNNTLPGFTVCCVHTHLPQHVPRSDYDPLHICIFVKSIIISSPCYAYHSS